MSAWLIISAVATLLGWVMARVHARHTWDAFGWPQYECNFGWLMLAVAGIVSTTFWTVAKIAIAAHG